MKNSTSFVIVLGIGAVLILACFLLPEQIIKPVRKETLEIFGPILSSADKPIVFFSHMNSKLATLDQAQTEVAKLRQEVAELQVRNQLLSDKEAENKRLREMLGFKAASKYELLPCRVDSREPSSWWDSVQINVGWENNKELDKKFHGKYSLTSDQPVVSPRGVVGKTGTVSRYVSDVILLVNENCSISATVQSAADVGAPATGNNTNTRHDQGIVKGQGNFEEGKPLVKVLYLPKDSKIAPGDFVVTSGLGPYFPPGLRLGMVKEVPELTKQYPTFGLYRDATVEPTANLNQLDELFIVLGPKEGETQETDSTSPVDSSAPAH